MCPGNAEVNIYRIVPHTRHLTGLSANTTQQPPSEVGVATDSIISLPKFPCWSSNTQHDGIWRWDLGVIWIRWSHGGGLTMGLVPLWEEVPESSPACTCSLCAQRGGQVMIGRGSYRTWPCLSLDLWLLIQELWENQFLLFKPSSLHYFIMVAWAD